jgi:hypothetical protein
MRCFELNELLGSIFHLGNLMTIEVDITGFTCVAAAYFVREEELPTLRVETNLCAAIGIDGFDAMT